MFVMSSAPDKRLAESARPTPSFPAGSAARALQLQGVLRVGVVPGTLGFVEQNAQTGRLEGIDVELADLVAQSIFGGTKACARKSIEFVAMRKAEREEALENGIVDLVISTYALTESRRRRVGFSKPYFGSTLGAMTPSGWGIENVGDLSGRKICVVEGSSAEEFVHVNVSGATVTTVESDSDMVSALGNRRADVVVGSSTALVSFFLGNSSAFERPRSVSPLSYAIGVRRGNDDLRAVLDATLDHLCDDGTLIEVAQRSEDRRARARRCW